MKIILHEQESEKDSKKESDKDSIKKRKKITKIKDFQVWLEALYKAHSGKGKLLFIRYTDHPERGAGINPYYSYDTPLGVYAYQLNNLTLNMILNKDNNFSFASSAKGMIVFSIDQAKMPGKIITIDSTANAVGVSSEEIKQYNAKLHNYMLEHFDTFFPNFQSNHVDEDDEAVAYYKNVHKIKKIIAAEKEEVIDDQIKDWKMEAKHKTQWNQIWNISRQMGNKKSDPGVGNGSYRWTEIMRKVLGISAIIDNGSATIHSNEPYQAVILDTSKVDIIYSGENKNYNDEEDLKRDQMIEDIEKCLSKLCESVNLTFNKHFSLKSLIFSIKSNIFNIDISRLHFDKDYSLNLLYITSPTPEDGIYNDYFIKTKRKLEFIKNKEYPDFKLFFIELYHILNQVIIECEKEFKKFYYVFKNLCIFLFENYHIKNEDNFLTIQTDRLVGELNRLIYNKLIEPFSDSYYWTRNNWGHPEMNTKLDKFLHDNNFSDKHDYELSFGKFTSKLTPDEWFGSRKFFDFKNELTHFVDTYNFNQTKNDYKIKLNK